MPRSNTVPGIVGRALRHPGLLVALIRATWRFRARGWWRRPPFLPLPPREYVDWRMHTAYGDEGQVPTTDELSRYVHWANRTYRTRRDGVEVR